MLHGITRINRGVRTTCSKSDRKIVNQHRSCLQMALSGEMRKRHSKRPATVRQPITTKIKRPQPALPVLLLSSSCLHVTRFSSSVICKMQPSCLTHHKYDACYAFRRAYAMNIFQYQRYQKLYDNTFCVPGY